MADEEEIEELIDELVGLRTHTVRERLRALNPAERERFIIRLLLRIARTEGRDVALALTERALRLLQPH